MSTAVAIKTSELDAAYVFLKYYLKENSRQTFLRYSRATEITIVDLPEEPADTALAEEMSLILLWGKLGTIILKTHFDPSDLSTHLAQNFANSSNNNLKLSRDFIKEFSNMQAGYIRGLLEEHNILVGMSLPFSTCGTDEIKFRKIRDPGVDLTIWKLVDANQKSIRCSAEIILNDFTVVRDIQSRLEADIIKNNSSKVEDDGDVEFI